MRITKIERTEAIFCIAVKIKAPDRRASFLDRACKGDEVLRAKVDEMLASHSDADRFFQEMDLSSLLMNK